MEYEACATTLRDDYYSLKSAVQKLRSQAPEGADAANVSSVSASVRVGEVGRGKGCEAPDTRMLVLRLESQEPEAADVAQVGWDTFL